MKKRSLIAAALLLHGYVVFSGERPAGGEDVAKLYFTLGSDAFKHSDPIQEDYTCDGADQSPPLRWSGAPGQTVTYAIIADDPDAPVGTWVHWVYYDIPASVNELPEAFPPDERPELGGAQGLSDFGRIGYGGPCPPGGTHRYFFRIYALNTRLGLAPGATKRQVLQAMDGHILGRAELMGTYSR